MLGIVLAVLFATAAPSAAAGARRAVTAAVVVPVAEVDIASFAERAAAYSAARAAYREHSQAKALELAAQGRAAEEARLVAEEAARVEAARLAAEEAARAEAARLAAEEAARVAAAAATSTTTTIEPTTTGSTDDGPGTDDPPAEGETPVGPTAAQWEALRQCESGGNYAVVSPDGRFRGAYQFSQATWDWVAGYADPSLLGVDPAAAAPGDQDAMALALWQQRGWGPWPTCGAGL